MPVPPYQLPTTALPLGERNAGYDVAFPDVSSPASPTVYHGYASPIALRSARYWEPAPSAARQRQPSEASYYGSYFPHADPAAIRSPASAAASPAALYLPAAYQHHGLPSPSPVMASQHHQPYDSAVLLPYMCDPFAADGFAIDPAPRSLITERDLMEQRDLAIPSEMPPDIDMATPYEQSAASTNEQRYLQAYWTSVHPFYPVVHKPSFFANAAPPLLRAAMSALGGQALAERVDLVNARLLHERCLKILKQRTTAGTHSYRVCDMQAMFLVELYAIFKSRRPPLQFSRHFEMVYSVLTHDADAWDAAAPPHELHYSNGCMDAYDAGSMQQIEAECKQRLLLACYTLDYQHAALFGRMRSLCFTRSGLELPFPSPLTHWDAGDEAHVGFDDRRGSSMAFCKLVGDAMRPTTLLTEPVARPHDTFQSLVLMACLDDSAYDAPTPASASLFDKDTNPLMHAVEQTPYVRLAFHAFELCRQTPMRDLLAVAGESWVMAEKLSSAGEYTRAQVEVRHWAGGSASARRSATLDVHRALAHAFSILEIIQRTPRTGLPFQEWASYLASLVVWARQYALAGGDSRQSPVSPMTPTSASPSAGELEQRLRALLRNGVDALAGWRDARTVLLWTKKHAEALDLPHTCGLLSGALDVLGKLVARGNEDGWF